MKFSMANFPFSLRLYTRDRPDPAVQWAMNEKIRTKTIDKDGDRPEDEDKDNGWTEAADGKGIIERQRRAWTFKSVDNFCS